jgi:hypothetical protein
VTLAVELGEVIRAIGSIQRTAALSPGNLHVDQSQFDEPLDHLSRA